MFLDRHLLEEAKQQADKGVVGRMEGHAEMDMSVTDGGSLWLRITRARPHSDQPLFRDGLGRGVARHRRRTADRGRASPTSSGNASSLLATRFSRAFGVRLSGRSWQSSHSCAQSGIFR
jgi:hypothetical protein